MTDTLKGNAVQGNIEESPDSLENLVNTIQNQTVTPTAVEIEHHNNFLNWLHSIDFHHLHESMDKYVVPALDIALPLLTDGTVSPKIVKDFYRFKFIFDLYKKWDEQVKTNSGSNDVTK